MQESHGCYLPAWPSSNIWQNWQSHLRKACFILPSCHNSGVVPSSLTILSQSLVLVSLFSSVYKCWSTLRSFRSSLYLFFYLFLHGRYWYNLSSKTEPPWETEDAKPGNQYYRTTDVFLWVPTFSTEQRFFFFFHKLFSVDSGPTYLVANLTFLLRFKWAPQS